MGEDPGAVDQDSAKRDLPCHGTGTPTGDAPALCEKGSLIFSRTSKSSVGSLGRLCRRITGINMEERLSVAVSVRGSDVASRFGVKP